MCDECAKQKYVFPVTTKQIRTAIRAAGISVSLVKEGACYLFISHKADGKIGKGSQGRRVSNLRNVPMCEWLSMDRQFATY